MPEEYDKEAAKCNNLTQLRKIAEKNEQFIDTVKDCLSRVKSDIIASYFFLIYS